MRPKSTVVPVLALLVLGGAWATCGGLDVGGGEQSDDAAGDAVAEGAASRGRAARKAPAPAEDPRAGADPSAAPSGAMLRDVRFEVVDFEAAPVPGARIRWLGVGRDDVPPLETDASGRAAGRIGVRGVVRVEAAGFATVRLAAVELDPVERVVLGPAYGLSGRVVDSVGRPIGGAQVVVSVATAHEDVESGADGAFAFDDLDGRDAGSPCSISVEAKGYAPWRRTVRAGRTDVRVVLRRPATLSGRVRFWDGRPVAGARLSLRRYRKPQGLRAESDAEGRFSFDRVAEERVRLFASVGGTARRRDGTLVRVGHWGPHDIELPDGGVRDDVEIVLTPSKVSYLGVRVLDAQGRPVPRFHVNTAYARVVRTTDATGRVVLAADVPAGTTFGVNIQGTYPENQDSHYDELLTGVTTDDAAEGTVELRLPRLVDVTLVLAERDGRRDDPPRVLGEGTHVLLPRQEGDDPWVSRWRLPAGRVSRVQVERAGRHVGFFEIEPREGGEMRLTLDPDVPVVGRVEPGEFRLDEIEVDFTSDRIPYSSIPAEVSPTTGAIRMPRGLPPGPAALRVEARGFRLVDTRVVVPATGELDLGTIELPGLTTVRGRVTGSDGTPLGGATVWFRDRPSRGPGTVSRADGAFAARIPVGWAGVVVCERDGVGGVARAASSGELHDPLSFALGPGGDVRVLVVETPPRLGGTTRYFVEDPRTGVRWHPREFRIGLPYGARHSALLEGVPAGRVRIGWDSEEWDYVRDVEVVAGETIDVELDLSHFRRR